MTKGLHDVKQMLDGITKIGIIIKNVLFNNCNYPDNDGRESVDIFPCEPHRLVPPLILIIPLVLKFLMCTFLHV